MNSLWLENTQLKKYPTLRGEKRTQVLIIGGGLCGILCARELKSRGVDCIVLEANRICAGTTGNSTAKITSQHGLIYNKITQKYGEEKARLYLEANEEAVKTYRRMCTEIECSFENKSAYVYSTDNRKKLEDECAVLNKIGFNCDIADTVPLPVKTVGALKFENQAQFDVLRFVSGILRSIEIYENTRVTDFVSPDTVITKNGRIKAEKIIVATHFPFIDSHGFFFAKMHQHRSYVCALEGAQNVDGMYVDESDNGFSFRNQGELLLLGGGGHKTGKQGGAWREIESFAQEVYPHSQVKYRWATQDCMTLDSIAYIGRYSKRTNNLYVATGFNKWGMTTSMVASKILADAVCEKENPYSELYAPSRRILHTQLFVNGLTTAQGLLLPTTKRCSHLGCGLKWNRNEHTWDCQCHGSRFDGDGKVLDGPAVKDI